MIREKYQNFLRQFVDKKYLQKYEIVTVLGDKILNGYYIVIFEVQEDFTKIFEELKW